MKKLRLPALLLALTLLLTGCFGSTSTGLLKHWECGKVTAARFYTYFNENGEGPLVEELPADRLEELAETLDSMKYKYHLGHTDYYWGGKFGIELELEDGTYWRYDGTHLERSKVPFQDQDKTDERPMRSSFVEVVECDFWKIMEDFFPAVKDSPLMGSW